MPEIVAPTYVGCFYRIGIKTEALTHGFSFNLGIPHGERAFGARTMQVSDLTTTDFPTREAAQALRRHNKNRNYSGPETPLHFIVANTTANRHWPLLRNTQSKNPSAFPDPPVQH